MMLDKRFSFSWKRVFTALGLVFLAVVLLIGLYILRYIIQWRFIDPQQERQAVKEVKEQVAKLPGVKIETLQAWEGEAIVTLDIKNKGKVFFWYSTGNPPGINSITTANGKSISTSFNCIEKTLTGQQRTAYTVSLSISKDNIPGRLFPFEIKNVTDLVHHFDDINLVLKQKFPRATDFVTVLNRNGEDQLIKNPDPKYAFKTDASSNTTCYYYTQ